MTITRRKVLLAAVAVAVIALGWWWFRPRPLDVEVAVVRRGPLQATVDAQGVTRVRARYTVAAPVAGRLARITLLEGDTVRSGDELARIDAQPLDPRGREEALARLHAAEDAASEGEARVAQSKAMADRARGEVTRARRLAASGQLAPSELEAAEAADQSAAADLRATVYRQQQLVHEVEVQRATLGRDRSGPIVLRAPVRGRVLRVLEKDERVVSAGTPLIEVGEPSDLEVVADVLSTDAVRVRPGDPLFIEGWGGATPITTRVRLVEPSGFTKISALGVEEQRVNVIATVPSPPASLGDRFRVEVRVVVWADTSVVTVPISAVFRTADAWSAFVVSHGRAARRTLVLGHFGAREVEVLRGCAPGDTVVLHPSDQLREGRRVRARSAP